MFDILIPVCFVIWIVILIAFSLSLFSLFKRRRQYKAKAFIANLCNNLYLPLSASGWMLILLFANWMTFVLSFGLILVGSICFAIGVWLGKQIQETNLIKK